MKETILSVDNLSKSFKNKQVLRNINFKVPKGELIILIGKNGAGKTTLINCIAGLITIDSGQVDRSQLRSNHIAVMMQENVVLRKIKVSELLTLAMSYYDNPMSYKKVVDLANLDDLENFFIEKLSGGQQRRVSFALAILSNSDLIVLDEPTASMDTYHRKQLWDTVKKLKSDGKTFIVTTHNLDELEDQASYALVLDKGQLIFQGYISDLKSRLDMSYVSFYTEKNCADYEKIQGVRDFNQNKDEVRLSTTNVGHFLKTVSEDFQAMDQLEIKRQSLEKLISHLYEEDMK